MWAVVVSVVLSLILFSGEIVGTREGTILTALLTGGCGELFCKAYLRR